MLNQIYREVLANMAKLLSHFITGTLRSVCQVEKRQSLYIRQGSIVVLHYPGLPHHSWKMGRIERLHPNTEGIVKETTVCLLSHRRIRRPLNLLVPVELEGTTEGSEDNTCDEKETTKIAADENF